MADQTKIEWCDSTFNPWIGCTKVSPGCDNCYAVCSTPARALGVEWGPHAERRRTSASTWAQPIRWDRQHTQFQAEHGRRRRVFCASLADVFDNAAPAEWRADLFRMIRDTPHLDWLLVTKRIGNVTSMVRDVGGMPDNVWLGITVTDQREADRDIPKLLNAPANVRFLSMEPLLGPVDLTRLSTKDEGNHCNLDALENHVWHSGWESPKSLCGDGINWVIVGGESGSNARPMHPAWATSLRDQCSSAGVPFLFKQWGEWAPADPIPGVRFGEELRRGHVLHLHAPGNPHGFFRRGDAYVRRVGKKAAGRLLGGNEHNEFPGQADER